MMGQKESLGNESSMMEGRPKHVRSTCYTIQIVKPFQFTIALRLG
jgi:hypothetical protein